MAQTEEIYESLKELEWFTGRSMREVLVSVRKRLGPDALIVRQEKVGRQIRVAAALLDSDDHAVRVAERRPDTPSTYDLHQSVPSNDLDRTVLLDRLIIEPPTGPALIERGNYRVVGPPGAGKSTLIGALAVSFVEHNPSARIALLSTDLQRIGANAGLERIAELIGATFIAVEDTFEPTLAAGFDLVLCDTASNGQALEYVVVQGLRDLLVLPASMQPSVLQRYRAGRRDIAGVALTQLNVAEDPVDALSLLADWQLSLRWLGSSAHVPGSIEPATVKNVAGVLQKSS